MEEERRRAVEKEEEEGVMEIFSSRERERGKHHVRGRERERRIERFIFLFFKISFFSQ